MHPNNLRNKNITNKSATQCWISRIIRGGIDLFDLLTPCTRVGKTPLYMYNLQSDLDTVNLLFLGSLETQRIFPLLIELTTRISFFPYLSINIQPIGGQMLASPDLEGILQLKFSRNMFGRQSGPSLSYEVVQLFSAFPSPRPPSRGTAEGHRLVCVAGVRVPEIGRLWPDIYFGIRLPSDRSLP